MGIRYGFKFGTDGFVGSVEVYSDEFAGRDVSGAVVFDEVLHLADDFPVALGADEEMHLVRFTMGLNLGLKLLAHAETRTQQLF